MGINDPMEKSEVAAEIVDEAERSVQVMLVRSGMTGMISLIPGTGDTINQMLTELAFKRTHDRMRRMFQEMSSRIREVNQDKSSGNGSVAKSFRRYSSRRSTSYM
jgi:hypothetical protein